MLLPLGDLFPEVHSYEEIEPTELVALTINELYMDFTFKTTEENLYSHIEFQTTNNSEKKDLRRFHSYEALFSHNMDAKVITYVIYTGGIEKTKGELECGMYTYRVVPIYMGGECGWNYPETEREASHRRLIN